MNFRTLLRSGSVLAASTVLFVSTTFAAPKAYVANFKDNTVAVMDAGSGKVKASIPVAAGPHGMVISSDGLRLYVSSDGSSVVEVIDTEGSRVIATIEVGKTPHGLALTPDDKMLLVAVNGEDRIAFVDTGTKTVAATVPVPKPHTVSIRPETRTAYVTSQAPGRFGIAVVDIGTHSLSRTIPLDKQPRDLEFGADGKVYFTEMGVNAVQVLDPGPDKLVGQVPTGESPHYANVFKGMDVGVAVVQGPGELLLFDPAALKPTRSIKVGAKPHWAAASADGKTVFVTGEASGDLTMVDVASGKTTKILVGHQPRKVAVH